jgi:hypothetical protein
VRVIISEDLPYIRKLILQYQLIMVLARHVAGELVSFQFLTQLFATRHRLARSSPRASGRVVGHIAM